MKKIAKNFIVILLILSASCVKDETEIDAPQCILDAIEAIKERSVTNPPTKVEEWKIDDAIYYYITADCCDQYNYLYDLSCNIVCAPDGGFTGYGDGNCPDFIGEIEKTLVWKDSRD